jgi:hypothetical protein
MHAEQLLPLPTASLTSEVKDHALVSFLGFGLEAAETVCPGYRRALRFSPQVPLPFYLTRYHRGRGRLALSYMQLCLFARLR